MKSVERLGTKSSSTTGVWQSKMTLHMLWIVGLVTNTQCQPRARISDGCRQLFLHLVLGLIFRCTIGQMPNFSDRHGRADTDRLIDRDRQLYTKSMACSVHWLKVPYSYRIEFFQGYCIPHLDTAAFSAFSLRSESIFIPGQCLLLSAILRLWRSLVSAFLHFCHMVTSFHAELVWLWNVLHTLVEAVD